MTFDGGSKVILRGKRRESQGTRLRRLYAQA